MTRIEPPTLRHDDEDTFHDAPSEAAPAASSPPAPAYDSPMDRVGSLQDQLARLRRARADREAQKTPEQLAREIEKEELLARFERELGPRGSAWVIVDTGFVGDPFIVAKKPAAIQFEKYIQGKMTPADRYDFLAPSIVHPSIDAYNAFRAQRPAIDISVSNAMQPMIGAVDAEASGK